MKIKVEPLYPTGTYLNVRLGVELDIPDDGDMRMEILTMWDNLTAIHMERYPKLYNKEGKPLYELHPSEEMQGTQVRSIEPEDSTPLVDQINSCKELKVLESYKLIVRNDEMLNAAYRKKLVELSNQ